MIAVEHLTKRYGDRLAVEDLSFTVQKGEIYGLLGPNGAGKSTTMNMMTGYISATEGTAKIDGYDIFEQPEEARRRIGYLPEQPPLYPDMTPREYLMFVAELKDYSENDFKTLVDGAMEKTGVTEVQHRLIRNLSKGYKQRVGLAGALLGEPEVLILDEPTVGLDPKQIIEIRTLIKSLAQKHTVLLSSHILSEISAVCDKVLIMSHGRLVACDTTENLSKMAEGSGVLCATVLGGEDAVRGALTGIEHVQQLEVCPAEEQGAVLATLTHDAGSDIRAQVSLALSGAQLPVLGLQAQTKTLEDVFLTLTGEDDAAALAAMQSGSDAGAQSHGAAEIEKPHHWFSRFGRKKSAPEEKTGREHMGDSADAGQAPDAQATEAATSPDAATPSDAAAQSEASAQSSAAAQFDAATTSEAAPTLEAPQAPEPTEAQEDTK